MLTETERRFATPSAHRPGRTEAPRRGVSRISRLWMIYVVLKSRAMSGKALVVSVSGGIIAHILLAGVYGGQKACVHGATGVLVLDLLVIATPILVGWVGRKFLGTFAVKGMVTA